MRKGYDREYYLRNKEEIKAATARWARNNRQHVNETIRRWRYYNMWLSPSAERNRAFGAALRRWRKSMGMSQAGLGRYLGVSTSVICFCESGAVPKRAEWFMAIGDLYEILKEVEHGFEDRAG